MNIQNFTSQNKVWMLCAALIIQVATGYAQTRQKVNDRTYNLAMLDKVARPVILNLANDELKKNMVVALADAPDDRDTRSKVTYLEAFGRTLSGIAPWLNLEGGQPQEIKLRDQYRQWTLKAIANAVNPKAHDYLKWDGPQPLVDGAFFALGLIRCPWLWEHLDDTSKQRVITVLKTTRNTMPSYNNWLLFSGMVEAFFCKYDLEYDAVRMEFGIREFMEHWYAGDGLFNDGPHFKLDYYNSYVIQPFLSTILDIFNNKRKTYSAYTTLLDKTTKRYAEIQEMLINSDGSFAATGRSIAYRGGAFQHLANMALQKRLPASLTPAQVRGALTAVVHRTLDAPGTFTDKGWLNLGLCGHQTGLADYYITTGSLYLCTNIFLPLGLSETDEYWSAPAQPWSAVKIWSGQNAKVDHALDLDDKK
ncbi:DUF2264 domain-containing protein [Mucilaginibacter daejeonensis]|uniref:DUF2264 domain-containing protein n=1 Tax=Mucilaginibacter daejeonensis TaxID=398049 RepID=UPI001D17B4F4|nr:DUF2264 domain-containing protein [Mucilaginibacter daejeonensis]UEG54971.1 DUF2264 domain-containing protein [Mucilaginibacter daejeonensis]